MTLFAISVLAISNCWMDAAAEYRLPPGLLAAIATVESGENPTALAMARNGTHSIGLMQINSSWFGSLGKMGITESDLYNPCINLHVGAWILAQAVKQYGYTWEAIGSYYAGPYDSRSYVWKLACYRQYSAKVLQRWQADRSGRAAPATRRKESLRTATPWIGDLGHSSNQGSQRE